MVWRQFVSFCVGRFANMKEKKIIWWHLFCFFSFSWLSGLFFFFPLFWIIVTYFNVILLVHSKTFIVFVLSKVSVATRLPKVAYHVYRNSYFVHLPKAHLALSQVFLKFNLFISIQKPLNTWVYIYIFFFLGTKRIDHCYQPNIRVLRYSLNNRRTI